jgi:hypothetical protein
MKKKTNGYGTSKILLLVFSNFFFQSLFDRNSFSYQKVALKILWKMVYRLSSEYFYIHFLIQRNSSIFSFSTFLIGYFNLSMNDTHANIDITLPLLTSFPLPLFFLFCLCYLCAHLSFSLLYNRMLYVK